jgi:ABC-type nickel/cobalt efflux system permease component RcnA
MIAVFSVAPAATALDGLPIALTIAFAATALVAIGMAVVVLRRKTRLTGLTAGLSVASAATIIVGALLVGGSLTQPPAAAANENPASRGAAQQPIEAKLTGLQLPTLAYAD